MAYWVWILWTIRLFYLFLNSPLLKFDPLLYLHPNLSESGNEHEGTSSYDLGKWRTLPLSHQAQKYFVWHCFYVFFFVTNEILKPITDRNYDQLQKYPRLLLASIAT